MAARGKIATRSQVFNQLPVMIEAMAYGAICDFQSGQGVVAIRATNQLIFVLFVDADHGFVEKFERALEKVHYLSLALDHTQVCLDYEFDSLSFVASRGA